MARCPSTDGWIKKMWEILHTMEFHSATKKNKSTAFASKCMETENTKLKEISQAQKVKA